jgi:DNA-binding transcriptional LysR family regulator
MELRHLRYFVAVAEALSFTRGAEALRLSQPSLTRQIRDLEEEIGVRLLNRTKQQVTLTEEGRAFLADARRVLALSTEIVDSVRRLSRHELPTLSIGYVANLFYDLLPATLSAFQRALPTVPVNLFDMHCGEQFRALHDGRLDVGFVGLCEAVESAGLEHHPVATYKTVAALNKAHPLTKKTVVRLEDLKPMFFIGMSENSYPGYRAWITSTCRQVGFTPKILQDVEIERTLLQSVAAGLGVALLPDQVKKLPHEDVVFRSVSPTVEIESCMAWKAENPSAPLKTYIEIVKKLRNSMR